jgi:hypothetical protein
LAQAYTLRKALLVVAALNGLASVMARVAQSNSRDVLPTPRL